jgi:hypothetical protein
MIEITLTIAELMMGAQTGINRHVSAIKQGLVDAAGYEGLGWSLHIEGACGEIAVSKSLGIYWSASVNTFKSESDIEPDIEVRTRLDHNHDLIVRENDNPKSTYILVTGRAPNFQIHGWIKGADARNDKWWRVHGGRTGVWFVPKKNLNGIDTLKITNSQNTEKPML